MVSTFPSQILGPLFHSGSKCHMLGTKQQVATFAEELLVGRWQNQCAEFGDIWPAPGTMLSTQPSNHSIVMVYFAPDAYFVN